MTRPLHPIRNAPLEFHMSRPMLRALLMLISALPFAAVAASQDQDQANDQTRRLIRQIMLEQRIPGLQVAVVKDGQIVLSEAYGLANVENGVRASRDTRFPLNSATKAFTAWRLRSWRRRDDWIWTRRPRVTWMIFRQRGETCAYTSCWRMPQAFRTSLMRTGLLGGGSKHRRGRR